MGTWSVRLVPAQALLLSLLVSFGSIVYRSLLMCVRNSKIAAKAKAKAAASPGIAQATAKA